MGLSLVASLGRFVWVVRRQENTYTTALGSGGFHVSFASWLGGLEAWLLLEHSPPCPSRLRCYPISPLHHSQSLLQHWYSYHEIGGLDWWEESFDKSSSCACYRSVVVCCWFSEYAKKPYFYSRGWRWWLLLLMLSSNHCTCVSWYEQRKVNPNIQTDRFKSLEKIAYTFGHGWSCEVMRVHLVQSRHKYTVAGIAIIWMFLRSDLRRRE